MYPYIKELEKDLCINHLKISEDFSDYGYLHCNFVYKNISYMIRLFIYNYQTRSSIATKGFERRTIVLDHIDWEKTFLPLVKSIRNLSY